MVVKIGIVKVGNIGTSVLIDMILDERADREDIDVRTISSGAKMGKNQMDDVLPKIDEYNPDVIIFISPILELNPHPLQEKHYLKRIFQQL